MRRLETHGFSPRKRSRIEMELLEHLWMVLSVISPTWFSLIWCSDEDLHFWSQTVRFWTRINSGRFFPDFCGPHDRSKWYQIWAHCVENSESFDLTSRWAKTAKRFKSYARNKICSRKLIRNVNTH